jgi:hypothetical protein
MSKACDRPFVHEMSRRDIKETGVRHCAATYFDPPCLAHATPTARLPSVHHGYARVSKGVQEMKILSTINTKSHTRL